MIALDIFSSNMQEIIQLIKVFKVFLLDNKQNEHESFNNFF